MCNTPLRTYLCNIQTNKKCMTATVGTHMQFFRRDVIVVHRQRCQLGCVVLLLLSRSGPSLNAVVRPQPQICKFSSVEGGVVVVAALWQHCTFTCQWHNLGESYKSVPDITNKSIDRHGQADKEKSEISTVYDVQIQIYPAPRYSIDRNGIRGINEYQR